MTQMTENSKNSQILSDTTLDTRGQRIRELLDRMEPFGFSGTVLLSHRGNKIISKGYGYMDYENNIPMREDAILSIGSISKQFTSTIILQLQDQNQLQVSDTLDHYFDEIPDNMSKITIHQLLTHTSGMTDGLGGDFEEISTEEFLELLWKSDLINEPGTTFHYSNTGFSVAAIIAQKVAGRPYQKLLQQLYESLEITTASWFGDPKYNKENSVSYYVNGERRGAVYEWEGSWDPVHSYWHLLGNGGITLSQEDMFRYISALFSGELLSESSLNQMLTPELNNYGYGWDIIDTPLGTLIQHNGGSSEGVSSIAKYYREQDLFLSISTNTIIDGFGMAFVVENLIEQLLYGEEITMPPRVHSSVDPREMNGEFPVIVDGEKREVSIETSENGPILFHFNDQQLLNSIMKCTDKQVNTYNYMNKVAEKFGNYVIQGDWDKAFQLCVRKDNYNQRVKILLEIMEFFEEQNGKITGIEIGGTIPFPDYLAMTLLRFVSDTGKKAGIPLIWENESEILGFRPLITSNTCTFLGCNTTHGYVGYSPQLGISLKLSYQEQNEHLFLTL